MTQTVIVTGATGGIGQSVTEALARKGSQVIALATRGAALEALARRTGCKAVAVDITDAEAVMRALAGLKADAVIHTAGILGPREPIYLASPETASLLLSVNVSGTLNILRATVPGMVERGSGTVVLLGSVCGSVAGGGPGIYSASKAALQSIAANLRYDLRDTAVRVSEIRLGRVKTGIHEQLGVGADLYDGYDCILPQDVAQTVLHVLDSPPAVDLSTVEMMPTRQVVGGTYFSKS
ncbi:MAG: SDR family NAD(P)-dependent oxidoreductase [Mesorhizobium sp.]